MKQVVGILILLSLVQVLPAKSSPRIAVTQLDNTVINGDLLQVDNDSIVVISDFNTNVRVPISNILFIQYSKRKGSFATGAAIGFFAGGASGLLSSHHLWEGFLEKSITRGIPMGIILGLITSSSGSATRIQIAGTSQAELAYIIKRLKKMALVK